MLASLPGSSSPSSSKDILPLSSNKNLESSAIRGGRASLSIERSTGQESSLSSVALKTAGVVFALGVTYVGAKFLYSKYADRQKSISGTDDEEDAFSHDKVEEAKVAQEQFRKEQEERYANAPVVWATKGKGSKTRTISEAEKKKRERLATGQEFWKDFYDIDESKADERELELLQELDDQLWGDDAFDDEEDEEDDDYFNDDDDEWEDDDVENINDLLGDDDDVQVTEDDILEVAKIRRESLKEEMKQCLKAREAYRKKGKPIPPFLDDELKDLQAETEYLNDYFNTRAKQLGTVAVMEGGATNQTAKHLLESGNDGIITGTSKKSKPGPMGGGQMSERDKRLMMRNLGGGGGNSLGGGLGADSSLAKILGYDPDQDEEDEEEEYYEEEEEDEEEEASTEEVDEFSDEESNSENQVGYGTLLKTQDDVDREYAQLLHGGGDPSVYDGDLLRKQQLRHPAASSAAPATTRFKSKAKATAGGKKKLTKKQQQQLRWMEQQNEKNLFSFDEDGEEQEGDEEANDILREDIEAINNMSPKQRQELAKIFLEAMGHDDDAPPRGAGGGQPSSSSNHSTSERIQSEVDAAEELAFKKRRDQYLQAALGGGGGASADDPAASAGSATDKKNPPLHPTLMTSKTQAASKDDDDDDGEGWEDVSGEGSEDGEWEDDDGVQDPSITNVPTTEMVARKEKKKTHSSSKK